MNKIETLEYIIKKEGDCEDRCEECYYRKFSCNKRYACCKLYDHIMKNTEDGLITDVEFEDFAKTIMRKLVLKEIDNL